MAKSPCAQPEPERVTSARMTGRDEGMAGMAGAVFGRHLKTGKTDCSKSSSMSNTATCPVTSSEPEPYPCN